MTEEDATGVNPNIRKVNVTMITLVLTTGQEFKFPVTNVSKSEDGEWYTFAVAQALADDKMVILEPVHRKVIAFLSAHNEIIERDISTFAIMPNEETDDGIGSQEEQLELGFENV